MIVIAEMVANRAAVLEQALDAADLVLAPQLMLTEVTNALRRLQRSGQLEADGLQQPP